MLRICYLVCFSFDGIDQTLLKNRVYLLTGLYTLRHCLKNTNEIIKMKQLDIVASPPVFLWDPYLNSDPDLHDL